MILNEPAASGEAFAPSRLFTSEARIRRNSDADYRKVG
jgi:hypothetical protein